MRSRSLSLYAMIDATDDHDAVEPHQVERSHYRRGRSLRTTQRRSSRKAGSHPTLGIAGRRNRQWDW